ncbi:SRPBCC family protein [Dactylosporangium aurantiacum]|uniref:SRPBCC family protein n=1 Tax=Dactylosporangium aurantiacum TaxID=35754 RepID=A0A9Q9MPK3_9ACTN|nr:SRPBCC family protein [Dactylosporangium aurantiacum]MDG6104310.1 SRPBCC family protein [Dactylosporangium aurantiacum]UWZ56697.1 SRPBCC family protein [Dactylosporangium aurantiacum]
MPVDAFAHTFVVAAPPARVYAHLADPRSYVGLSPLVVAVRDVHTDGDRVSYVALERFRFWTNPIRVTMTLDPHAPALVSEVVSPGRVRLRAAVTLAPAGTGTEVTEAITVESPWVLRRYVLRQARAVQLRRAAELTRRMSASG